MAASLLPELASVTPSHHWAGVRPGSDRDWPYLGPVPGTRGVFAALAAEIAASPGASRAEAWADPAFCREARPEHLPWHGTLPVAWAPMPLEPAAMA